MQTPRPPVSMKDCEALAFVRTSCSIASKQSTFTCVQVQAMHVSLAWIMQTGCARTHLQ